MTTDPVVIASYARTPMGGMQGVLSGVSATQLGATAIKAAVERAGVKPEAVDQVIMGCVLPGALGQAPARQATLGDGRVREGHHAEALAGDTHVELGLECDSAAELDALVERLRGAGYVFEHGPVDQSWQWREARLRDPDGNMLLLFHGGAIRRDPPWKLPPGYSGP